MTFEAIALWTESSSDPELIAGVRAGDSAAFGVLYERHAAAARKVAAQYTNSPSDVDDVVAEAFSRVLRALQRGDGPDLAFRAYLFTTVRRTGMDVIEKGIRTKPRDDMSPYESAIGLAPSPEEPALDGFEHLMVADAFRSIPERWQAVLWYTEVEKKSPREIAPLLGLSANGVAALAYRAREALRQAYLQQHLNTSQSAQCLEANAQLGAYVRGGLSKREHTRVDGHVRDCDRCSALVAELEDVNRGMRAVVAPLFLGVLGAGALEGGLPIGGVFGSQAAVSVGASGGGGTGGAGGVGAGAGATGAGGTFSATGIAGLVGAVSHLALPAAAVVGVTALALNGGSVLGWFTTDDATGGPGGIVVSAPSASPSPSSAAQVVESSPVATPDASPSPATSPVPVLLPPEATQSAPAAGDEGGDTDDPTPSTRDGVRPEPTEGEPATRGDDDPEPSVGTDDGGDASPRDSDADPGVGGDVRGPSTDDVRDKEPSDPGGGARLVIDRWPLDYLEVSRTSPRISVTIANEGESWSETVTAQIRLPEGLQIAWGADNRLAPMSQVPMPAWPAYALANTVETNGWQCAPAIGAAGAECERDGLEKGDTATLMLDVAIVADDLDPNSVTYFDVHAGTARASYAVNTALGPENDVSAPPESGEEDDVPDPPSAGEEDDVLGPPPAGEEDDVLGPPPPTEEDEGGGLAVAHFGGTVMGCFATPQLVDTNNACRRAMDDGTAGSGQRLTNDDWHMTALNMDGGARNSGTTTITLPEGSTVTSAFLEWSASRSTQGSMGRVPDAWSNALDTARVRVGAGDFVAVTAGSVDDSLVEGGHQYYLSRADVTELIADADGAVLTVADIAVAQPWLGSKAKGTYGGFTLTVVYEDPAQPARSTVALFEGPHWVTPSTPASLRFDASAGALVTPSWTVYEGDRGIGGERLTLTGEGVRLLGPGGEARDANDLADSRALGSPWSNTLGIDAKRFATMPVGSAGDQTLRASTTGDTFLIGTMAVTIVEPAAP